MLVIRVLCRTSPIASQIVERSLTNAQIHIIRNKNIRQVILCVLVK